jgi:hypothetical protein
MPVSNAAKDTASAGDCDLLQGVQGCSASSLADGWIKTKESMYEKQGNRAGRLDCLDLL